MSTFDNQLVNKQKVAINTSSSKQMYSFGKQYRFKEPKKCNENCFYDLPSTLTTRKAGIGIGTKSDFTKGSLKGKTENFYDIPREFELFRKNSPQYSFGKGREVCKLPQSITLSKNFPGPGKYDPYKKFGSDALKFSVFGRTWDKPKKIPTEPGPGQYKYLNINTEGKYSSSLFNNSPLAGFSHLRSKRFKTSFNDNPAPNAYFPDIRQNLMNGTGYYYCTKYSSKVAKTMGSKLHVKDPVERQSFPGPGSYEIFSDFGGFSRYKQNKYSQSKKDIFRKKRNLEINDDKPLTERSKTKSNFDGQNENLNTIN